MTAICSREFRRVVAVAAMMIAKPGEMLEPVCFVFKELPAGPLTAWSQGGASASPISIDTDTLFVTYMASDTLMCFDRLGWPRPQNILDLFVEFKNLTNGLALSDDDLMTAVSYLGGQPLQMADMIYCQSLIMRCGPFSSDEQKTLLKCCHSEVLALEFLLAKMAPELSDDRPLMRGRYMAAVAVVEAAGIPIDTASLELLKRHWSLIRRNAAKDAEAVYPGVFMDGTLSSSGFGCWLDGRSYAWPLTACGTPKTDQDTLREWSRIHPEVRDLKERITIIRMPSPDGLTVGRDGRNRYQTGVFGSVTGRNQPRSSQCIFGLPGWLRGLVQPPEGYGLALVDYVQEEFGIAAALSGDEAMMAAYSSGDCYLGFAVQSRFAPHGATKSTHREIRERFKIAVLGVQYGMGEKALAQRLRGDKAEASHLLSLHRQTFRRFWRWQEEIIDTACCERQISTVLGWQMRVTPKTKEQTLRNFPMQGNGAEILRLAVCLAVEMGVRVVAMIHDAILIEAPISELGQATALAETAMRQASESILGGFALRTDTWSIGHPARLLPHAKIPVWNRVWGCVEKTGCDIPPGIVEKEIF